MRSSRRVSIRLQGFTIVELLIVVVIIAILAAIVLVTYNGIQDRARASVYLAKADATQKAITAIPGTTPGYFRQLMPNLFQGVRYGTVMGCLGTQADFPAQDGFAAGECFVSKDQNNVSVITASVFDEATVATIYDSFPSLKMGKLPVATRNLGGPIEKSRGILVTITGNLYGASYPGITPQTSVAIQWVSPDFSSCGRATASIPEDFAQLLRDNLKAMMDLRATNPSQAQIEEALGEGATLEQLDAVIAYSRQMLSTNKCTYTVDFSQ